MPDVAPHECPHCGRINDAVTEVHDPKAVPSPGDVSVCFGCAGLLVWTEEGGVRLPTPEELPELEANPEVRHVRALLRASLVLRPYRLGGGGLN